MICITGPCKYYGGGGGASCNSNPGGVGGVGGGGDGASDFLVTAFVDEERHGVADHQIWARFWIGKDSASFGQDLGPRLCEVFGSGRGPNLDLILGPRGFQDVGMFMDIWHKGPILPRFGGSAWLS